MPTNAPNNANWKINKASSHTSISGKLVEVRKITQEQDLEKAFKIREEVFVKEQNVAPEEEYDAFERSATHFLALDADGNPCGTARWRITEKGIKLERFAVLKQLRGTGIGSLLVKAVLEDIAASRPDSKLTIYMHAQSYAVPFYRKFGFTSRGEEFEECGIMHFTMTLS